MKRRLFLKTLLGAGLLGLTQGVPAVQAMPLAGRKKDKKIDGDKVVFISDLHISPTIDSYTMDRLRKVVDTILSMSPRPSHVICLGDIAYLTGRVEEYRAARPLLEPLWKAGIKVTLGMGNHDRREEFAEVFPEFAAATRLPGRHVYKVELPQVDIIVLDSLQQGDDKKKWITPGKLDDAQRRWLQSQVDKATKPFFVSSHHAIHELGITSMLAASPMCCGYIHGHDHVWRPGWGHRNWKDNDTVRTLCLPSTGFWGDIGYSVLHLQKDQMLMTLHQDDFYFPRQLPDGKPMPRQWQMMIDEHQGAQCAFNYAGNQ